jgi:hypothetical protein
MYDIFCYEGDWGLLSSGVRYSSAFLTEKYKFGLKSEYLLSPAFKFEISAEVKKNNFLIVLNSY